jgi:hypothetical protein
MINMIPLITSAFALGVLVTLGVVGIFNRDSQELPKRELPEPEIKPEPKPKLQYPIYKIEVAKIPPNCWVCEKASENSIWHYLRICDNEEEALDLITTKIAQDAERRELKTRIEGIIYETRVP